MRNFFLLLSCLLLTLLCPVEQQDRGNAVLQSDELASLAEAAQDKDVLYDNNRVTLHETYDSENDDVVLTRLNRWGRQLRVMNERVQHCNNTIVWQVKRLTHLLSVCLTTLVNNISQSYSSLKLICWQYSVDCYVFAFRQIII